MKKHIRTIAAVAIAAVLTIATRGAFIAAYGAFWGAVATGALAGFASGAIMIGTLKGALTGAVFGAISAGVAFGVAEATSSMFGISSVEAHGATLLKSGMQKVAVAKSMMHGLTRGLISMARGGTFKSGFASGFTSSAFSVGTKGYGGFVGRTAIMSIVGGTASKLGGGKFSNGAVSGAFVHMFNAEGGGMTLSKGVSYVANGVQLVAGRLLSWTGIGAVLGVPMMAHASNNLYETYTGEAGLIREGEEALGLNYDYTDIGVSVVSGVSGAAKVVGMKSVSYMGTNAIRGYVPVSNISTMTGKADAALTASGVVNTANAMNRE